MSRTYMQHPEMFPYMRNSDPYYMDHVSNVSKLKIDPVAAIMTQELYNELKPKCDVCGDIRHSTSLHILSIETNVSIEEAKEIK